jgi:hypothetical protein
MRQSNIMLIKVLVFILKLAPNICVIKYKGVTMTKIRIGCSPITGTIYAGSVSKNGLWGKNKVDVTNEALNAVSQSLLQTDEVLRFKYEGEWYELFMYWYELSVKKIQGGNNEGK